MYICCISSYLLNHVRYVTGSLRLLVHVLISPFYLSINNVFQKNQISSYLKNMVKKLNIIFPKNI